MGGSLLLAEGGSFLLSVDTCCCVSSHRWSRRGDFTSADVAEMVSGVSRHHHGATCRQDHGARWKQMSAEAWWHGAVAESRPGCPTRPELGGRSPPAVGGQLGRAKSGAVGVQMGPGLGRKRAAACRPPPAFLRSGGGRWGEGSPPSRWVREAGLPGVSSGCQPACSRSFVDERSLRSAFSARRSSTAAVSSHLRRRRALSAPSRVLNADVSVCVA